MTNIKRTRELVGYLVSIASLHDEISVKKFADELEELIPKEDCAEPQLQITDDDGNLIAEFYDVDAAIEYVQWKTNRYDKDAE